MVRPDEGGAVAPARAPQGSGERVPNARGEESRAAILEAAKAQFAANGFRGASLASVADGAGLSQPGLLHHFPSKVALLLAVLEDRDREDGKLSSAHLTKTGVGILAALESLVQHNQANVDVVRLFSVLLGEGLADDHPAHAYMVERYERIRSRLERNLLRAEEDGEIAPGTDRAALAAIVVAVMDGLQFQWLLDPSMDMAQYYRAFRMLVESAVQAPGGERDRPAPGGDDVAPAGHP
ncbi:MAG: TetR/AcrR family transcriptional regulator [Actinomycetota bacterium]|nr:TetR/AcrR family transcriptional regulator [Actinomycetota bacterium]